MPVTKKSPPKNPNRERAEAAVAEFRAIITRNGWTQQEASHKSKFGVTTINRWFTGAHTPYSKIMIEALEKFNAKHRGEA